LFFICVGIIHAVAITPSAEINLCTAGFFVCAGRYYVSLVGYNNALAPSRVACSDGVTYDTTPPALVNVSITHARGGLRVGCTETGEAWLVNGNLTRVALDDVTTCRDACSPFDPVSDVNHLPLSSHHTLDPHLS
jgi:hypothetical protein